MFDLYLREYSKQLEREDAPPPDGLPDSEDDDGELSYHVELLDLIGMCAKGSNKETEEFAESFFSPTDLLTVPSNACRGAVDGRRRPQAPGPRERAARGGGEDRSRRRAGPRRGAEGASCRA